MTDWYPAPEPLSEEEQQRHDDGAERADLFAAYLSRNDQEHRFLDALSVGHTVPSARRMAGLSRYRADKCLQHCREVLTDLQFPL